MPVNVSVFPLGDADIIVVVFTSKSSALCKLVCSDTHGTTMLTRTLHSGRFEKMLVKRDQRGKINLSVSELELFLNGEKIFERRSNFYPNK